MVREDVLYLDPQNNRPWFRNRNPIKSSIGMVFQSMVTRRSFGPIGLEPGTHAAIDNFRCLEGNKTLTWFPFVSREDLPFSKSHVHTVVR